MNVPLGLRDWGAAELTAGALGALGLVSRQPARRVSDWFERTYRRPAHVLDSGSTALKLALECLAHSQPGRTQVILPALACPAVTRATQASGLQPVYADIGPDLNPCTRAVERVMGPRTLALVMVHAYGCRADVEGLSGLCERQGVALIDDAAQRVDPAGQLGAAGDFGILSFAQSKSVVTGIDGSGGVLLVNRAVHADWVAARLKSWSGARGRSLAWLEFAAMGRHPRLAYAVGRLRHRWPQDRQPSLIGALDAAIAEHQLHSLQQRIDRRVEHLGWYRAALSPLNIDMPQLRQAGPTPFLARLMIRLDPADRQACRAALAASGIASRLPYRLAEGAVGATCPRAQNDAESLLELPLPASLTLVQVEHIASVLAAFTSPSPPTAPAPQGQEPCATSGS